MDKPLSKSLNAERCRAYYLQHRAKRLAYQKAYNKINREKRLAYAIEYGKANAEMLRAKALAYRKANLERIREYDRRRSNTDRHRESSNRYYHANRVLVMAKMKAAREKRIIKTKAFFGNKCGACSYSEHTEILQFDHVVPLVKKGRLRASEDRNTAVLDHPERFQLLCPICHAIKTTLLKRKYPPSRSTAKQQRFRQRLLATFGRKCRICAYDECDLALQFDHIKPKLKQSGGGMKNLLEVKNYPELFQLLCANCHTLKTIEDMNSL